jgi:hypothetical protein
MILKNKPCGGRMLSPGRAQAAMVIQSSTRYCLGVSSTRAVGAACATKYAPEKLAKMQRHKLQVLQHPRLILACVKLLKTCWHQEPAPNVCDSHASDLTKVLVRLQYTDYQKLLANFLLCRRLAVATCSSAVSGRNHQDPAPKICDRHASDLIVVVVR